MQALEAGEVLPDIIVCGNTKQIVDGFHRYFAYRKYLGPEGSALCELRKYKDDAARLLDSVLRNARHGRRLATFEKIAAYAKLKNLRVSQKSIASAMGMKVSDLRAISLGRTATVGVNGATKEVPIKRTISHMSGKMLTAKQLAVNEKLGGSEALYFVNQIIIGNSNIQ